MKNIRIGIDIGSTTIKAVAIDDSPRILFSDYRRHHSGIIEAVVSLLEDMKLALPAGSHRIAVTGSVGMGLSERLGVKFVQEVSAATEYVRTFHPGVRTMIDIGGEDAKIVYIGTDGNIDLRMNGNCAGGTGAFIDQMALILGVEVDEMNYLALRANTVHPIASRCGVFSKTDVQNLIAKKIDTADIAASIFHAVAVQTIVTLSHGYEVNVPVLFCGGPMAFIPALRKAFTDYLEIDPSMIVVPEKAFLLPAWGAALLSGDTRFTLDEVIAGLAKRGDNFDVFNPLPRLFENKRDYEQWRAAKSSKKIDSAPLPQDGMVWLGIDSGSTTTKITAIDDRERVVFGFYSQNNGDPVEAVRRGLTELSAKAAESGAELHVAGSCCTGYGEDLIKAAFNLDSGIIETIAHYLAAKQIDPDVSFILDIGGQDMKAIFVDNGAVKRMEINEACSSGCGSFIDTFARSMNSDAAGFAAKACESCSPSDLGTRCTVFMNSKVKQVLKEGADIADIAAGLSYSVVKNCIYKVLKLKNVAELGDRIVLQGGTMKNDSIVRIFELLTGKNVYRSNIPELMGAYGSALYARANAANTPRTISDMVSNCEYTTRQSICKGCVNNCAITSYRFSNDNRFFSGNKCEKVFSNSGAKRAKGDNISLAKYDLTFRSSDTAPESGITVGIPRVLNIYENYPFWKAMFDAAGIRTVLSDQSTWGLYERGVHNVMSDNICFPAKLAHGHIDNLIDKNVGRIFMPYVVFERMDERKAKNSYNCPIVAGYSDVIKSVMSSDIPFDAPVVSFKTEESVRKTCGMYLRSLGISRTTVRRAITKALEAQRMFEKELAAINLRALKKSQAEGRLTVVLAGRPYHADPLIQHKISDMVSEMGVTVITEDIVRAVEPDLPQSNMVTQWSYTNRILRATNWAADQDETVQFVQMTSFGCGPDAFLLDEVDAILKRKGKNLTVLKIDDVNNIGSLKLRVRSLVESLRFHHDRSHSDGKFVTTVPFRKEDRRRKILAPFFTEYISPLLPDLFAQAGYDMEVLPVSDALSSDYGLKYANNEVCYPATLIVGDIIKALDSGRYDLSQTAVAISQTGGQCRASNYLSLIKKGVADAGYPEVPVITLGLSSKANSEEVGFDIPWFRLGRIILDSILFSDCISKFYHASVVREIEPGKATRLRDYYINAARTPIRDNSPKVLQELLKEAVRDFNSITLDKETERVGIVGEIFLKFNGYANHNVAQWFIDRGVEVVPPTLIGFFMQGFVNRKVRKETCVANDRIPEFLADRAHDLVHGEIERFNAIASGYRYFLPFNNIFHEAENGSRIVSLSAQFGEGWLLPAEVVSFAENGVNNVVSLQPFGCIANHIVAKGVEKRIKTLYPQMNLLALDFDSGVSETNIRNRLHLMADHLR